MIQHSPHSGFSELIHDLWRNKPVFITVLVALGFGVYLLIKNSQNQAAASAPAQPATPTFTNLTRYVQENFIQPSATLTMTQTQTVPGPTMTQTVPTPGPTQTQTVPTQPVPQPQPSSGNPLIPYGNWPQNVPWAWGQKVTVGGTPYTIGPGSNGIIWGVPNFSGNETQWNAVPIGSGPGQKVAVYVNNPAAYH